MITFEEQVISRLKRLETKQTHMMESLEINTQNTEVEDLNHPLITIKKVDNLTVISLLHKDISILKLESFLKNHFGNIIIMIGDKILWTIQK